MNDVLTSKEIISQQNSNSVTEKKLNINTITTDKDVWFKISNHDKMRPFFMNVVSDSNHWMFISSNGGLTAGRKNNQYALFPYYTDDKITESADITGSKSIFRIHTNNGDFIWEPFSERYTDKYQITRNLYKNYYGNKIMFEEINHDLGLSFRYQWNSSNLYGFVRKSVLYNHSEKDCRVTLLDGIQNIMPYGVEPDMQMASSNLVDAYKKNELISESGMGIFALSAIIVDKAEPSEALKANIAWSLGLDNPKYLLSSLQLNNFRNMQPVEQEHDIKGEKGAYFVQATIELPPNSFKKWKIVANVNQSLTRILELNEAITEDDRLDNKLEQDVIRGAQKLLNLISAADGMRSSADALKDVRHYSNVLFNIMRGGIFDNNYQIEKKDFCGYIENASKEVYQRNQQLIDSLQEEFNLSELIERIENCKDPDFYRLSKEYLPLKFSRRHGDPSRPWNQFSINTHSEVDGSKILDYEGNWRDIFQNWEALVYSYPGFIEGMIFKFLNTSTFDGYNPYRVTKGGFDWEIIEPDNPWSYIGYWGDHQIIYLLKFLEFYHRYKPDGLKSLFDSEYFVYANVPYRIKSYDEIVQDPKNTIDFDYEQDQLIREKVARSGADGALLRNNKKEIHRVNFSEKILATLLAKVSNFIPEGGIWMNTQRPEWNDANNALVGNGVSMVTLCYMRRFLKFFEVILEQTKAGECSVSEELNVFFSRIIDVLDTHKNLLRSSINDRDRKSVTDGLGRAGSDYRKVIYEKGFTGKKTTLKLDDFSRFVKLTLRYLEHSIDANRRPDNLFHSYNLMSTHDEGISISQLSEMLEGQVAVLSSGYLSSEEAGKVLDALRNSALYRKDQNSYMLYPNKELPRFLEKNNIPVSSFRKSKLLQKLVEDGDMQLILRDLKGGYHFNGNFRNASDLKVALESLKTTEYKPLVEKDYEQVLNIFEEVFNHKAFTGRSGTFYAYEGLGSIYWHMVSKLHLASKEVCLKAIDENAEKGLRSKLLNHFKAIGDGIGIHKSPDVYGAYPTDPYSHTPWHRGAQQPGMTGQVKEDILTTIGELGVCMKQGRLSFKPKILRISEFTTETTTLQYVNIIGDSKKLNIPRNALAFSCCQVPVIYKIADKDSVEVTFRNNYKNTVNGLGLDKETSQQVFRRAGEIEFITVYLKETHLI